ncbi:unnamed protein product [Moneuplotes crassus]|uniref:Cyclin-dependent kinase 2 homolog n=1 Tax=Euplotes crassus TaxID=5936 RepID=A0AAD1XN65_EUPCR|nr:unnamed protein product [Moneuplotes crassus]
MESGQSPEENQGDEKYILLGNTKCVAEYEKIKVIGEAKNRKDGKYYALKKIRMANETDGFPITSLREIKLLQKLSHPNIIDLKEVSVGYKQENVFLVFDYYDTDLANLVDSLAVVNKSLSLSDIKMIMEKLLLAVEYMHRNEIMHRDLKISNILVNKKGDIRVADFGLAREMAPDYDHFTKKVVTLWYRAPEILLGCHDYSTPSDIWALGCIFGELLCNGKPLFPGSSEIDQFQKICNLIGKPNKHIWPDYVDMEVSAKLDSLVENEYNDIPIKFKKFSPAAVKLLEDMLVWDPLKRITAEEALQSDFFNEPPFWTESRKMSFLNELG